MHQSHRGVNGGGSIRSMFDSSEGEDDRLRRETWPMQHLASCVGCRKIHVAGLVEFTKALVHTYRSTHGAPLVDRPLLKMIPDPSLGWARGVPPWS